MTDGEDQGPPRSWLADALNPVENLRALADAGQFGRRAVEGLADRMFVPGTEPDGDRQRPSDVDALLRRVRADTVRAADLWADLIEGAAAVISTMAARLPGSAPDAAAHTGAVELGLVAPGEVATTIFWAHNSSADAIDEVRPHCSPLRSHRGDELAADVVSFDPPLLDPLPPRSRCGIEVRVAIPDATAPATYVTVVLLSNVPTLYLPLRVDVVSDPPL